MNYTTEYQDYPKAKRNYKDTLFCMIFGKKEDQLNLYNAVNGTDYENPDDLEIMTLDNAIYMSFKNDVAFLLDCFINLYEHQSSYNPNMPIRGYLYFAQLFEKFIASRNLNIYSTTLQKLPTPKYLVFYNGTKEEPEETMFCLSDTFLHKGGCLECKVTMLNINYGKNKKLMEKCKKLEEYALFISKVRALLTEGKPLQIAINQAIDESIEQNVLRDILIEQRAEVLGVLLSTFNKELYEKELKEDAYSQGAKDKLLELVQKKLAKGKSIEEIAEELEESVEVVMELIGGISEAGI